jgi:hypothetical protein
MTEQKNNTVMQHFLPQCSSYIVLYWRRLEYGICAIVGVFTMQHTAHTQAILFVASPYKGSRLAEWARIPAGLFKIVKDSNTKLLSVLDLDSEVRDRIYSDFMMFLRKRETSLRPIRITCLFETLKLGPFMIVLRESVILNGYINIPVQANHKDIVRFDLERDQNYVIILDELKR